MDQLPHSEVPRLVFTYAILLCIINFIWIFNASSCFFLCVYSWSINFSIAEVKRTLVRINLQHINMWICIYKISYLSHCLSLSTRLSLSLYIYIYIYVCVCVCVCEGHSINKVIFFKKAKSLFLISLEVVDRKNIFIKNINFASIQNGSKSNRCFRLEQRSIIKCWVPEICQLCEIYRRIWDVYDEACFSKKNRFTNWPNKGLAQRT